MVRLLAVVLLVGCAHDGYVPPTSAYLKQVAPPDPNGECLQTTRRGRASYLWRNGEPVADLAVATRDDPAASRIEHHARAMFFGVEGFFWAGLGTTAAALITNGALLASDRDDSARLSLGVPLGISAGTWLVGLGLALGSDALHRRAMRIYNKDARIRGCRSP